MTSLPTSPWAARAAAAAVLAAAACMPAQAATQVLFDPAGGVGLGSWLSCAANYTGGCTTTDTALAVPAGSVSGTGGLSSHSPLLFLVAGAPHVNAAFPVLNRAVGYRLSFDLGLTDEQHVSPHRAGFSVTLVGHDLQGVEIGFQQGVDNGVATDARIFVQADGRGGSTLFTQGDSTTAAGAMAALEGPNRWHLDILGTGYSLSSSAAGGVVLSGALRDYSAYSGNGANAYRTANFLFLGDNTSSAGAAWQVGYAALTTPVPEPGSAALALAGLLAGLLAQRWRARRAARPGARR